MLERVSWPYADEQVFVDGWQFDDRLTPGELPASDLAQPSGIRVGSRRWVEWTLGRLAGVQAATRAGVVDAVVTVEPSGAPRLAGSELGLSIAHTTGVVLAAVSPDAIGIDVERSDRDVSRLVRSLHIGERDIALSIGVVGALVAKEAVAKATGLGLGGSLARWPVIDAELNGSNPVVNVATPDDRIVSARLFPWQQFIVGIARIAAGPSLA
jgi:4'-phosphopantetheinyl transferase EntD